MKTVLLSFSQVSGVVLNINMYKEVTDPNTGVIKFQTINLESTEKVNTSICAQHKFCSRAPGMVFQCPLHT